mgnify:FL=1
MNIKCIDTLGNELKNKLKVAKKECMTLTDISYVGVIQKIEEGNQKTTIYSLLPKLENIQFLKRENGEEKEVYMVKHDLVATISEKALEMLLQEVNTTYIELTQKGFYRGICLPEEIEMNLRLLERLSLVRETSKMDSLFTDYANLIAEIRKIQTRSIDKSRSL